MSTADRLLAGREALGWRLGLDRMRRVCSLLGNPQRSFESVHVVGTNGKSSVTRLTAAILGQVGCKAGAYVSPHLEDWRERILLDDSPIGEASFERALLRAEEAAQEADRSSGDDGPLTQFELVTAASFCAFEEGGVDVAVIEAGLGGRLDATNVIPSRATVLTSVGLDHTEWLGGTLTEIATEKLDVLRPGTTLITGELPQDAERVAGTVAVERGAPRIRAEPWPWPGAAAFQQHNLGLAASAASVVAPAVDEDAVARARDASRLAGRFEVVPGDPDVVMDVAHNPDGAEALAEAVSDFAKGRLVVCCLALLADKDAEGVVAGLGRACGRFVCTEVPAEAIEGSGRPTVGSHAPEELASICSALGREAEAVPSPSEAWKRAIELAGDEGGVALAAGSHYLLGCLYG